MRVSPERMWKKSRLQKEFIHEMEGSKIDLLTVSLLSLSLSPSLLHFWVVYWLIWPEPVCIQQVQTLQLASTRRGGCKGPPAPPTYFGKADKRDKLGEKSDCGGSHNFLIIRVRLISEITSAKELLGDSSPWISPALACFEPLELQHIWKIIMPW